MLVEILHFEKLLHSLLVSVQIHQAHSYIERCQQIIGLQGGYTSIILDSRPVATEHTAALSHAAKSPYIVGISQFAAPVHSQSLLDTSEFLHAVGRLLIHLPLVASTAVGQPAEHSESFGIISTFEIKLRCLTYEYSIVKPLRQFIYFRKIYKSGKRIGKFVLAPEKIEKPVKILYIPVHFTLGSFSLRTQRRCGYLRKIDIAGPELLHHHDPLLLGDTVHRQHHRILVAVA